MLDSKLEGKEWWLFIHNRSNEVSAYDWNGLNMKRYHRYILSYNVKAYQLLPHPYRTDCVDYRKHREFMSRKACIRQCKVEQALDKCGALSRYMDVYNGGPNYTFALSWDEYYCVQNLSLSAFCHNICPNYDCYIQHMEQNVMSYYEVLNTGVTNYIEFFVPFEPKTKIIHKPRIEFTEFLCYLASTVSLWFGFSFLDIKRLILVNSKKFYNLNLCCHLDQRQFYFQNHVSRMKTERNNSRIIQNDLFF